MSVNEAIETQLNLLSNVERIKSKDKTLIFEEIVHRSLQYGSTYFWSQDFVRLLEGQANLLPDDAGLSVTDFLSEAGFIFFERPVAMPIDPTVETRFEEWEKTYSEGMTEIEIETDEAKTITSQLNFALDDYHKPDGSIDIQKIKQFRENRGKGTLRLHDALTGRTEERQITDEQLQRLIKGGRDKLGNISNALERWGDELAFWHAELEYKPLKALSWVMTNEHDHPTVYFVWWTVDKVLNPSMGMYPETVFPWYLDRNLSYMIKTADESKYDDDPTRITQALKYACASVLFMTQKVFAHSDERPNRAVRHRISSWRPDPIVKVIRLRRQSQPTNPNAEHNPIEHAFQWMVGGHWRNQWYSKTNEHKTIWIAPFIKGPPDKPLKEPRARVFAIVR